MALPYYFNGKVYYNLPECLSFTTAMAKEYNYMIEKDIRQGDREKNLLNALLKLNRVKLDKAALLNLLYWQTI